uniref:Uncharacterized protein n=1 Tax=Aegilops tauschii subsp. strangulata TaxID=200361 RepID=A0A452XIR6_AEGTS
LLTALFYFHCRWSRQEGPGAPPSVAGRTSTAATQASPWTQGGVEEKQLAWTFRFSLMSEKKVRLRCSDIQVSYSIQSSV